MVPLATLPHNLMVRLLRDKWMTSQKIAIGLVAVALFVGSMTAHGADFDFASGMKAYNRGDYATALRIFRQFADQGYAPAQNNLGVMYHFGKAVTQDYVHAHMWYSLAAARGEKVASKWLDILAEKMTPDQIAEAQKLAREWKPKRK